MGNEEQTNTVLDVWQSGYSVCHHGTLNPRPKAGERYRVVGFLDYLGLCPDCVARKKREGTARKAK